MNKKIAISIAAGAASLAGIAMGSALVLVVKKNFRKLFGEMQNDVSEQVFTSPDGNHVVKVLYGASETANGMALVSVTAISENDTDTLLTLERKSNNLLAGEWSDNNNFRLLIGSCSKKQCYDITFGEKKIRSSYYLRRITNQ